MKNELGSMLCFFGIYVLWNENVIKGV